MITAAQLDAVPERIREKIAFGPSCWIWLAFCNKKGYGRVKFNGKSQPAHRVLYKLLIGPIPDGITLDHGCLNKKCVNPDHMGFMTVSEAGKQGGPVRLAISRAKTHCKHGHPWNEKNTRIDIHGKRHCRACEYERHAQEDVEKENKRKLSYYKRKGTADGCDSTCWYATLDMCTCSCKGQNHGIGHSPFTT